MSEQPSFWDGKHTKFIAKNGPNGPSFFVQKIASSLPSNSKVLELGCGYGQDAVYLARMGHHVVATDISHIALAQLPEEANDLDVETLLLDTRNLPYPFQAESFDIVYAHLSLHYFSAQLTRQIFSEIARILCVNGRLLSLFNSIKDAENGSGAQLEPGYYELSSGDRKRFFSAEEMPSLLPPPLAIELAEYGTGTVNNKDDQFLIIIATKSLT